MLRLSIVLNVRAVLTPFVTTIRWLKGSKYLQSSSTVLLESKNKESPSLMKGTASEVK